MKTNSKQFKAMVTKYIIESINSDDVDMTKWDDKNKLMFLCNRFRREYCYAANLKHYGSYQTTFANWVMGLPSVFNVAFTDSDIIDIAIKWGSLTKESSDKDTQKVLDGWLELISCKTLALMAKHGINYTID